MKIYIVLGDYEPFDYGETVESVWLDKEKAWAEAKSFAGDGAVFKDNAWWETSEHYGRCYYWVEEFEVKE